MKKKYTTSAADIVVFDDGKKEPDSAYVLLNNRDKENSPYFPGKETTSSQGFDAWAAIVNLKREIAGQLKIYEEVYEMLAQAEQEIKVEKNNPGPISINS